MYQAEKSSIIQPKSAPDGDSGTGRELFDFCCEELEENGPAGQEERGEDGEKNNSIMPVARR